MGFTSHRNANGLGRSLDAMDARDGGAFTGVFAEVPTRHVERARTINDLAQRFTPMVQQATAPVVISPSAPPTSVIVDDVAPEAPRRFPIVIVALVLAAVVLSQE